MIEKVAALLQGLFLGLAKVTTVSGKDNPLYVFCACYSINYNKKAFKPINFISQHYSAIVRGYQYLVLLDTYKPVDLEVCLYYILILYRAY